MESIDILTGQNVTIQYQPATILQRLAALLLDRFFIFAYFLGLLVLYLNFLHPNFRFSDSLFIVVFLLALPVVGYHFIFESIWAGRTPGKMIVKIKVTNVDGSVPGIGSYFLRWLLMPVDMLLGGTVGALFIILSQNHQRLGDMAAGTIVIKTNPSLLFDLDESYYEFADDYDPTFINVDRLSNGQIAFLTKLLIEPKNKAAVDDSLSELAGKVKAILNVESKLDDRRFLETILRDYNYYATLEL
jgi:uncharacterized RDD family membrane protein YckC